MSKELVKVLTHLLDKADPGWQFNHELVSALESLQEKKRFSAPTLQDVTDELRRLKIRNHQMQADKFWNFYEGKGWMVGKNKMKNWKAAIKTWNFEKDSIIL